MASVYIEPYDTYANVEVSGLSASCATVMVIIQNWGTEEYTVYSGSSSFTLYGLTAGRTYTANFSFWNKAGSAQTDTAVKKTFSTESPVVYYSASASAGTGISSAYVNYSSNVTVEEGTTVTYTCTPNTGYNFSAWYSGSSVVSYSQTFSVTVNSNISYTAKGVLKTYTVSYNANGGSGAPSSQTKTYGSTLTLSSTVPTRTGYTFQGWSTSSSGSVAYQPGSSYTTNAGATLYAIWKINTYTISYNANGGSGAPSNQTKTYNTALILSSTIPTRNGYEFLGWAESADATEPLYLTGASYTKNEAKTLYAVWKKKGATIYYGKGNTWIEAKAFYGNGTWKEIVLSYGKDGVWKQ